MPDVDTLLELRNPDKGLRNLVNSATTYLFGE
jgi:hypothetical protein